MRLTQYADLPHRQTASLLSFVTYCLAAYPGITLRVREEIKEVLSSTSSPPTMEQLKSMRYCTPTQIIKNIRSLTNWSSVRAVINETLRLFPPVPMNIRRAGELSVIFTRLPFLIFHLIQCLAHTTTLSSPLSKGGPFVLPKDVSVTYAPILMQRRKDVWGDDAEDFNPDRWINPKPHNKDSATTPTSDAANAYLRDLTHVANPFAFVPFNAGPRICLGMSFALAECMYTVVRMMQTFQNLEIDESKQVLPPHASQPDGMSSWRSRERCWPRASLTLYIQVCAILPLKLGIQ